MKLWADLLNLREPPRRPGTDPPPWPLRPSNTQDEYAELADGVASAVHWRKRPPNARIRPYDPIDHRGKSAQQVLEENIKARLDDSLKDSRPTVRTVALHHFASVEAFLRAHGVVESRIWDEVLDPPSPL